MSDISNENNKEINKEKLNNKEINEEDQKNIRARHFLIVKESQRDSNELGGLSPSEIQRRYNFDK